MKRILLTLFIIFIAVNAHATNWCEHADILACYTFDSDSGTGTTLTDDSAEGIDGTFKGSGEPAWSSVVPGSGDGFDGTSTNSVLCDDNDDYIQLGAYTDLRPTDAITLVFWAYPTDGSGYIQAVAQRNSILMQTTTTGSDSRAILQFTTAGNHTSYGQKLTEEWVHYAITWDGTTKKYYMNGEEEDSDSVGGGTDTIKYQYSESTYLCKAPYTNAFGDYIDEVAFFDSALSQADIQDIMANGLVQATNWCEDANNKGCFLMEDSGNETDEGKGNTLIETSGTIPQSSDKKFGTYSRDFEAGDTEYLTHADSLDTDISGADQSLSIVAWYKPESSDSYNETIVAKKDISSNHQYELRRADNVGDLPRFIVSGDGSSSTTAIGGTALTAGTWYHIAAVYNDTDLRVYVDGILDSNGADNPKTYSGGIYAGNSPFAIGVNFSSGSPLGANSADGLIDDVGIFDRALSAADVLDIYNNGLVQSSAHRIPTSTELRNVTLRNIVVR